MKTRRPRFQNLFPIPPHRFWDLLRWQLRLAAPEPAPECVQGHDLNLPRRVPADLATIHRPDPDRIQLTWVGHSTFLIQFQGKSFLTDPVFSNYCSPVPFPRLRRAHPPTPALRELPFIDGILISHNHYDHLDRCSVQALAGMAPVFVPAGLKRLLERWGVRSTHELHWWQSMRLGEGIILHCVPSQHFSARHIWDRNQTLWAGWILEMGQKKIFFAGDTGYCPVFQQIARLFGPMDLALIPIGAYRPRWFLQAMHVDPFEVVQIHQDLQSRLSVASHWGTFRLTDEPMGEPAALLEVALERAGVAGEHYRLFSIGQTVRFPASPSAGG